MNYIRPAKPEDLARIAEIMIFNYRMYFYPIFRSDWYFFDDLQVPKQMERFRGELEQLYVYDDGVVKGFLMIHDGEVRRLFVEPIFHSVGIGAQLLEYAVAEHGANRLWALEKNTRAIAFYARHGFLPNGDRKPEEGTEEYLIRLVLKKA